MALAAWHNVNEEGMVIGQDGGELTGLPPCTERGRERHTHAVCCCCPIIGVYPQRMRDDVMTFSINYGSTDVVPKM
jgi:hypothetical protein